METVEELIKFAKDGEDVNMKKKFLAVKGFDQASIGAILLAASLTVRVNRILFGPLLYRKYQDRRLALKCIRELSHLASCIAIQRAATLDFRKIEFDGKWIQLCFESMKEIKKSISSEIAYQRVMSLDNSFYVRMRNEMRRVKGELIKCIAM